MPVSSSPKHPPICGYLTDDGHLVLGHVQSPEQAVFIGPDGEVGHCDFDLNEGVTFIHKGDVISMQV